MHQRPKRILGYARVSSAEQALGTSLQDQQDVLRAYAKKRGLKVDRMYVEAESAVHEKAERRVQIQALMGEMRQGDLVVVDKVDRWSRDPEFTYGSIRQMLAKGVAFYAIGDDCDPSTPTGDSMLGMRVFFAREEHKRIKIRMVGTRKLLRDRGYYVEGIVPTGYRRQDVKGADRNVLVVHEEEAEHVRRVFRLCISGHSLSEIAEKTDTTRDRVCTMVHSRTYLGEARDSHGNWIQGKHPAIITPRLFAEAQASLERRKNHNGRFASRDDSETSTWWLRNVARCALCKSKMSAAYGPGGPGARRHYYRCYAKCTSHFVRVDGVEEAADRMVADRLVELRAELARAGEAAPKASVSPAEIEASRRKLDRKRERYVEAFADGAISRDQLRAAMSKLDDQRTRIDAIASAAEPVTPKQVSAVLADVTMMRRAWDSARPTERRIIVESLAKSALLAAGRAPRFEWYSVDELAQRH